MASESITIFHSADQSEEKESLVVFPSSRATAVAKSNLVTSYPRNVENILHMAEYPLLLSPRVAAYVSEINWLKVLVAKLQRMQSGKISEKIRARTERLIQEAQNQRISGRNG